ncbi:MAG: TetR/AcrR family transcriptional regulator [Pseudomonadota bacterium]
MKMAIEQAPKMRLGRPRKFDEDKVLDQIVELFWQDGYEATGLNSITSKTGLVKASLYAAFGNKREMYLKALARYEAVVVDPGCDLLRDAAQPPAQRLRVFFSLPINAVRDDRDLRGCFLCNASADQASVDPEIAEAVQRGYAKLQDALADLFLELGETRQKSKSKAAYGIATYTGLRVMARSGTPVPTLELARDSLLRTL